MENPDVTFYLNSIAHDGLKKDQILFHIGKNESTLIKRIIVNYYPKYNKEMSKLNNKIKESIASQIDSQLISEEAYVNVAWKITKYLCESTIDKSVSQNKKNLKVKLHFRINKKENDLDQILMLCPSDASKSEFIANIIYSYLNKPQYERERIVFKEELDRLEQAISENQQVRIVYSSSKSGKSQFQIIHPYKICVSKEELFNYVLFQKKKNEITIASTMHLYNIITVYPVPYECTFNKEILNYFKRMEKNGVQYSINEDTIFKIRLTEQGKQLYHYNYLEKPIALDYSDSAQGIYCFDCSRLQFRNYFSRFYSNVEILEPKNFREEFLNEVHVVEKLYL